MLFAMRWIPVSAESPVTETKGSGLRLEGLNVSFATPGGLVHAVRGVSLAVAPGECLGVVGESGSGKSQSFLATLGLLSRNARVSGRALLGATDLLTLDQRELDAIRGRHIGMVFQDPMTSLTPHRRIGEQIAEPIVHHLGVSRTEARARALELLNQVHVTEASRRLGQYPHELSGGMRQRVMLAIALSCRPSVLIADEPTTALDVTIQAQILSLLMELKRSHGMAMVLITHDMGAVAGVADRVAVMRNGEVVECDTVGSVFNSPRHEYTRGLLTAVPRIDDPHSLSPVSDDPVLVLDDLHVRFKVFTGWIAPARQLRAVDGVSLSLSRGEALGIVGESGSGKSTLARAALQLLSAHSGRVVWLGRQVDELSSHALRPLRRDVQVIFQDPLASLDPRMTVAQIVAEPLLVHQPELTRAGREAAVSEALGRVRLEAALSTRYPHELSGGQCQRVGLARAMVLQPRLLVCDEPVSALDVTVQAQIVTLLAELKRESGLALLFISHNLAVVRQLCERVLVLYLGRMMELATTGALFEQPLHPYTRELLESVPIPDPAIQPARLARTLFGEPPSALSPPSGCVYRTRCPFAVEVCQERVPIWEPADSGLRNLACHRWRDMAGRSENRE